MSNISNPAMNSTMTNMSDVTPTSLPPNQDVCVESEYYLDMWANAIILYKQQHVVMMFDFVIFGIIMSIISAVGLLGNSVTIYILLTTCQLKSVAPFLICLGVADNIFIAFNHCYKCILFGLKNVIDLSRFCSDFGPYKWYGQPLLTASYAAGSTLTVTIAIVRYISISRPLKAKVWLTDTINKRISITAALIPIIPCIVMFLPDEIFECFDTDGTLLMKLFKPSKSFALVIIKVLLALFTSIIPWVLLVGCNALLLLKLRVAKTRRSNMSVASREKSRSSRVTVLLICMTMSSVVLIFPQNCFYIIEYIKKGNVNLYICQAPLEVDSLRIVNAIHSLATINSCINFFWLMTLGTEFRTVILKLFRRQPKAREATASTF